VTAFASGDAPLLPARTRISPRSNARFLTRIESVSIRGRPAPYTSWAGSEARPRYFIEDAGTSPRPRTTVDAKAGRAGPHAPVPRRLCAASGRAGNHNALEALHVRRRTHAPVNRKVPQGRGDAPAVDFTRMTLAMKKHESTNPACIRLPPFGCRTGGPGRRAPLVEQPWPFCAGLTSHRTRPVRPSSPASAVVSYGPGTHCGRVRARPCEKGPKGALNGDESYGGSHFVPVSYSRETAQGQRLQHFTGTRRFPATRERVAFGSKHCDVAPYGQVLAGDAASG